MYWVPLDPSACELIGTGFIKIPTSLPDITLVTTTDPKNQAGNNGIAVITFVGGVGPFTYTLNSVAQGAATSPFTINGLLASTTYTVQIIDSNNTDSETFTLGDIAPLTNVFGITSTSTSLSNSYFYLGGNYTMYLCPIFSSISSEFPGYENINTRLAIGNYFTNGLRAIRLFTPLDQTTNLTVEVFAQHLGIDSTTPYSSMTASLVYIIAPTDATNYVLANSPKIQFPNLATYGDYRDSPTLSWPNSASSAARYNTTYSVTIPNINVGETLYVCWRIIGSNAAYQNAYFQYKGFKITLKKYS